MNKSRPAPSPVKAQAAPPVAGEIGEQMDLSHLAPEVRVGVGGERPLPSPGEMAGDLLAERNRMIIDHYSATQGRRVMQLMELDPTALLAEVWRAAENLNATTWQLARSLNLLTKSAEGHESMNAMVRSEMLSEAYQALYPAVETPEEDELSHEQRQRFNGWLESLADEPEARPDERLKNLFDAARKGELETVRRLVDGGLDPAGCDQFDGTALHAAAAGGHVGVMDFLLSRGVAVNGFCTLRYFDMELGWHMVGTPLHVASVSNQPRAAALLIDNGANVNAIGGVTQITPVFYAAALGANEALEVLLREGALVNVHESRPAYSMHLSYTPLHYAASNGHARTVQLLLAHEANPRITDPRLAETPLDLAKTEGHSEVVEILAKAER